MSRSHVRSPIDLIGKVPYDTIRSTSTTVSDQRWREWQSHLGKTFFSIAEPQRWGQIETTESRASQYSSPWAIQKQTQGQQHAGVSWSRPALQTRDNLLLDASKCTFFEQGGLDSKVRNQLPALATHWTRELTAKISVDKRTYPPAWVSNFQESRMSRWNWAKIAKLGWNVFHHASISCFPPLDHRMQMWIELGAPTRSKLGSKLP